MNKNSPEGVGRVVSALRSLDNARLEDLPYFTAPPIQFVYEEAAALALGNYIWPGTAPLPLTPPRPILENYLYFIRNVTLTADIAEFDYTANIVTNATFATAPTFQIFMAGDSNAPRFREALVMNMFFNKFDYRLIFQPTRANEVMTAAFRGQLQQGPSLVGKNSITLKAIISAQEITDTNFIELFKAVYPHGTAIGGGTF